MGEQVDRRGFLRFFSRDKAFEDEAPAATEGAEGELSPRELQIKQLQEFSSALVADFGAQDEEQLAEGPVLTNASDQAYMRVTAGHVIYTTVTGNSVAVRVGDVVSFETEPPVDGGGYGDLVYGVLRAHHPADLPTVTRSYVWRFPAASPLLGAIRMTCGMLEPEPEAETVVEEPAPEG